MYLAKDAKTLSGWPIRVAMVDLGQDDGRYCSLFTLDGAFPTLEPFAGRSGISRACAVIAQCSGQPHAYRLAEDQCFLESMGVDPSTVP